jgi:hypothetical protein
MIRKTKAFAAAAAAVLLGMSSFASAANLAISLGVRETGTSAAIGANGGTAGTIEWVNLDGLTLPLDGLFHTFTFNFGTDPVTGFTGNGVLDGTRGVLEHVRIRNIDGTTAPLELWIDNIRQTTAAGPATVSNFEGFADGTEVTFQEPSFSGSTSANVFAASSSLTTSAVASQGLASDDIKFQFVDSDPTRWVRLTTNAAPNLPNPAIDYSQGNTLSFDIRGLVVPEPGSAMLLGLGSVGMLISRRRK